MSVPTATPPASVPASPVREALVSLFKTPAFLVTFLILLVGAVTLNAATSALRLHFRKQAVPLAKDIKTLPKQMGPWVQVSLDMPLSPDIQEVLGTDKYIFRDYVDSRVVPPDMVRQFEGKDPEERRRLLGRVQGQWPHAVLILSVTYYTGMVDTVAHIPDRCFVADGYRPTVYQTPRWKIPTCPVDADGWTLDKDGRRPQDAGNTGVYEDAGLPVRFINFEDQDTRMQKLARNVTYFFQVNGRWESDPIGVRSKLQNLFERHGYYAKVELMTMLADTNRSAAVKQDFLSSALPELEKCLPDWGKVTTGSWPPPSAAATPAGAPATAPATAPARGN